MLDVRINFLKNRLYLTLDQMHSKRLERSIPVLENAAKKLTPGFTCITRVVDIREPEATDFKHFEKVDQLLSDFGLAHVVYVGLANGNRLPPFSETPPYYTASTANTIEAAERQLDLWEASVSNATGPRFSN